VEQSLGERVLHLDADACGPGQESVRVEAVDALDAVPLIVETFLAAELAEASGERSDRSATSVLAGQHLAVRLRLPWRRRIQLKRSPAHDDLIAEIELRSCAFEAALPQPAPRADDIGEHFDLQAGRS